MYMWHEGVLVPAPAKVPFNCQYSLSQVGVNELPDDSSPLSLMLSGTGMTCLLSSAQAADGAQ